MWVTVQKNEEGDICIHKLSENELSQWAERTNSKIEDLGDGTKVVRFKIGNLEIKLFN